MCCEPAFVFPGKGVVAYFAERELRATRELRGTSSMRDLGTFVELELHLTF
jgi:hypothetical protein